MSFNIGSSTAPGDSTGMDMALGKFHPFLILIVYRFMFTSHMDRPPLTLSTYMNPQYMNIRRHYQKPPYRNQNRTTPHTPQKCRPEVQRQCGTCHWPKQGTSICHHGGTSWDCPKQETQRHGGGEAGQSSATAWWQWWWISHGE